MIDDLIHIAEERLGIKADPDDVEKLRTYIQDSYGTVAPETIDKVFSSGEAAGILTVNETYFFREPAHFSFLLNALPSFEKTGIRICSAAVASGCEAYSIAMLIEAYNRGAEKPLNYHIDAFDVNPKAIEAACRGAYSPRALREDGSCFRHIASPYLKAVPGGQYQIDPSLGRHIRFFVHNLMHEFPPQEYDLIFFRNAFIYVAQRHRERVLSNLVAALREGGLLMLGVSETAMARHPGIEAKNLGDLFYFQKPSAAAPGTCGDDRTAR